MGQGSHGWGASLNLSLWRIPVGVVFGQLRTDAMTRGRGDALVDQAQLRQFAPMIRRHVLELRTPGRGTIEITRDVQAAVARTGVEEGLCTVFVHHTSASLIMGENADPSVRTDLDAFFARLVPDGDALFTHTAEGKDDMPAHIRSVLTQTSLTIPVVGGRCDLGTWQGIFLWEHRYRAHHRRVTVSVMGAAS